AAAKRERGCLCWWDGLREEQAGLAPAVSVRSQCLRVADVQEAAMKSVVADSLLRVSAGIKPLLADAVQRLDSIGTAVKNLPVENVAASLRHAPSRDFFDYFQAFLAPVSAIGAAWLGAWYGGRQSRLAAVEAIAAERRAERTHSLDRLVARIRIGFN